MRRALASVFLFIAASAFGATAPDSIAGKIYRDSWVITSVRSSGEITVVLGADNRFSVLKTGGGFALILTAPYKIFLDPPHPDGTYTYTRTGESTATLDLSYGDGTKESRTLQFLTATSGGVADSYRFFYLTDAASAQNSPANNLSMRGRVSPGHPLVVGFVVPGDASATSQTLSQPPPGVTPREVLIRVVGPSLAAFGVAETWADSNFQLYRGNAPANTLAVHYADWCVPVTSLTTPATYSANTEAAFRKIFNSPLVGAFPLLSNSKDAVEIVRLNPGAYTVVCNTADGDAGGEALVEVYFLP